MYKLRSMVISRISSIYCLLLVFTFASCSKFWERDDVEKKPDPVPVSMEFDGVYMEEDLPERTRSQFYLRKHSFSYFISMWFTEVGTIRMLVSSDEGFELDRWYNLPTEEAEGVWESFAELEYNKYSNSSLNKDDKKAVSGKVKFTKFKQEGELDYCGEGYCAIGGEFYIVLESKKILANPIRKNTITIKNGKFYVPKSGYWDSRAMED